jgi:hypothetical protein
MHAIARGNIIVKKNQRRNKATFFSAATIELHTLFLKKSYPFLGETIWT